jgi:hypothetical protein
MEVLILLKRRGNNLSRFFELFEKESVISIKEIKRKTSSSTFYKIILKEILSINEAVKTIEPALEFMRPVFRQESKDGPVFHALERAVNVSIDHDERFFFLRFNRK